MLSPYVIFSDGVLRDRFVAVSDKQSFRGGGGGDLGQWGILRKAVPGEVHQRCHAGDLCSGEDYSCKDCRLRRHFGLAAVSTRHDQDLVADGHWRHCQFHRYIHQHWVPTVSTSTYIQRLTFNIPKSLIFTRYIHIAVCKLKFDIISII